MATSLSAYWVKFFKGAGFPQDVATKHAVVFSNNRIKPDMLPDLDKPSLKEMGIILMGDMIAILRYAKKVVEETTCEKFLVDSEDIPLTPKIITKPVVKKIVKDNGNKTISTISTVKTDPPKKIIKPLTATMKKIIAIKKSISTSSINDEYKSQKKQIPMKRKLISKETYEDTDEDNWSVVEKKEAKMTNNGKINTVEYTVPIKKIAIMGPLLKKSTELKRTVFDRLGDSSVTSTTNLADTMPTFNVTGVSKDVFKRSTNVFKRLGDIDDKKDHTTGTVGILKNGSNCSQGILKNRTSGSMYTSIVTTKKIAPKITGTMRADHEVSKKLTLNNTNRILKLEKKTVAPDASLSKRIVKTNITPKLASERLISIPAKDRLGVTPSKQVTFSKITTVTHMKKPDVFSRLGV